MEHSNFDNTEITEIIKFKENEYKFYSNCSEYCYYKCTFVGCKGKIRHFLLTKENYSWSAHSLNCRRQRSKNNQNTNNNENNQEPNDNNKVANNISINGPEIKFEIVTNDIFELVTENKPISLKITNEKRLEFTDNNFSIEPLELELKYYVLGIYQKCFPNFNTTMANWVKNNKTKCLWLKDDLAGAITYKEIKIKEILFLDILLLGVDPYFQGKGFGRALIADLKPNKMVLWADNEKIGFYEKMGFKFDPKLGMLLENVVKKCVDATFMEYGFDKIDLNKLKKV